WQATGWRTLAIPSPSLPYRSATNPKAPSAQPSKGSWAVLHGHTAVARNRLPLHITSRKPPAQISSNLSQVNIPVAVRQTSQCAILPPILNAVKGAAHVLANTPAIHRHSCQSSGHQ